MTGTQTKLIIDWRKLNSGYLQVPKEILAINKLNGEKLSMDLKVLYSYLANWYHRGDGTVLKVSYSNIMEAFGIGSKSTVTKHLGKLENFGLIKKSTSGKGSTNSYEVLDITEEMIAGVSEGVWDGTNKQTHVAGIKLLPYDGVICGKNKYNLKRFEEICENSPNDIFLQDELPSVREVYKRCLGFIESSKVNHKLVLDGKISGLKTFGKPFIPPKPVVVVYTPVSYDDLDEDWDNVPF